MVGEIKVLSNWFGCLFPVFFFLTRRKSSWKRSTNFPPVLRMLVFSAKFTSPAVDSVCGDATETVSDLNKSFDWLVFAHIASEGRTSVLHHHTNNASPHRLPNHTQPIIPWCALTKCERSRHQQTPAVYSNLITVVNSSHVSSVDINLMYFSAHRRTLQFLRKLISAQNVTNKQTHL